MGKRFEVKSKNLLYAADSMLTYNRELQNMRSKLSDAVFDLRGLSGMEEVGAQLSKIEEQLAAESLGMRTMGEAAWEIGRLYDKVEGNILDNGGMRERYYKSYETGIWQDKGEQVSPLWASLLNWKGVV